MKRELYDSKRAELLAAAQTLLDEGKVDESNQRMSEVEELDERFENEARVQANLNALAGAAAKNPMEAAGSVSFGASAPQNSRFDSEEYKAAFMNYVVSGIAIPRELRNVDQTTTTGDVGAVIPVTTMQKIYERMEKVGGILSLVTQTSYKGGVSVPTSAVKPTAVWVNEGEGSDRQKKPVGAVTFAYYKLRCAISMTLETSVVTYPIFETQFVRNVADAMVDAKEKAIITGNGVGCPKGIVNTDAPEGQNVVLAADAEALGYEDLARAEAALPEGYDETAVWCMSKKTFFEQVVGMTDLNGQPIARVNYGIGGKPEYSIFGRRVALTKHVKSFAPTVTENTVFAFLFDFQDYILNSAMAMRFRRFTDDATDDEVAVAIELADGKPVCAASLVTLTKQSA